MPIIALGRGVLAETDLCVARMMIRGSPILDLSRAPADPSRADGLGGRGSVPMNRFRVKP